jgi:hypothetical protein
MQNSRTYYGVRFAPNVIDDAFDKFISFVQVDVRRADNVLQQKNFQSGYGARLGASLEERQDHA